MAKVSKQVAHYRPQPNDNERCEGCSMWQPPDNCTAVEGVISPRGWCELFEAKRPAMPDTAAAIKEAVKATDRNPTDAEKAAGNYSKGKFPWKGLTVAIETPKGALRSGVDKGGKKWSVRQPENYGYVLGSLGKDGDHVDVYVGSAHTSGKVWIIDQVDAATGRFDEHKAFIDFPSKDAAMMTYGRAFSDGKAKDRLGAITEMSAEKFVDWVKSGNTKKPLGLRQRFAEGGRVDVPLIKSAAKGAVSHNIKAEMAAGKGHRQSVAIALETARRYAKRAFGGRVGYDSGGRIAGIAQGAKRLSELPNEVLSGPTDRLSNNVEDRRPTADWPAGIDELLAMYNAPSTLKNQRQAMLYEMARRGMIDLATKPVGVLPGAPYAHGGRTGYAEGGWAGELDSPAPPEPSVLAERPRSPVPDYLLGQQRDAMADRVARSEVEGPYEPTPMPTALQVGAELTGLPSIVRGAGAIKQGYDEGSPLKAGMGAIEAGGGLLPGMSVMRGAAPVTQALFGSIPRAGATMGTLSLPGMVGSGAQAAEPASTMDRLVIQKDALTKDRAKAVADRDAQTAGKAKGPDGKPIPAGRGPKYDAAVAEVARIDQMLATTDTLIAGELKRVAAKEAETAAVRKQNSPEAQLAAEKQRKTFEAEQLAKEYGKPIREHLPPMLANAVLPVATLGGLALSRYLGGKFNAEYTRALEGFKSAQKATDVPAMALHQKQLQVLENPSFGQKAATVAAAGLPFEVRGMETLIDAAQSSDTRANQEAWARLKDPIKLGIDVGAAVGSSALAHSVGRKIASNAPDRSLGKAIASEKPYGGAQGLADDYGSALKLTEDLGRLRQSADGVPTPPPIPLQSLPAGSAPKALPAPEPARLADRLPAYREAVSPPPAAGVAPNLSASPSSTPERPVVIIRSQSGTHHMGDSGHFAEKHLYSKEKPKPKSSTKGKSKPAKGKGNEPATEKEAAPGVPFKEPKPPGGDFGFAHGGSIDSALATARHYAKYARGGVVVGAVKGATGGRADAIPVSVPAGSFVIPSDCVSGMPSAGNNTEAGMAELEKMFGKPQAPKRAYGGAVPIQISHGEFVLSPEQVARVGHGDVEKGHRTLEAFVKQIRAQNLKAIAGLPPPAR